MASAWIEPNRSSPAPPSTTPQRITRSPAPPAEPRIILLVACSRKISGDWPPGRLAPRIILLIFAGRPARAPMDRPAGKVPHRASRRMETAMTTTTRTRPPAARPAATRGASDTRYDSARLHRTKNDLPEATRSEAIGLLNQRLAECIDLATQCKQAHWNVKGPSFIDLHALFPAVHETVEDYADLIAERIVQLGDQVRVALAGLAPS